MKVEKNDDGIFVVRIDSADVELGVTNNIEFWNQMHAVQAKAEKLNKIAKKSKKADNESQSTEG